MKTKVLDAEPDRDGFTNQRQNVIESLLMVNNKKQTDLYNPDIQNVRHPLGINHQNLMQVYNDLYQKNITEQLDMGVHQSNQLTLAARQESVKKFQNQSMTKIGIDNNTSEGSNPKSPRTMNTNLSTTKQPYKVIQNIVLNPVLPVNTLTQSYEFNRSKTEIELLKMSNSYLNNTNQLNASGTLQPIIDLIQVPVDPSINDNLVKEYQKILERQDSHTFMQQHMKTSNKSDTLMANENTDNYMPERLGSPQNPISKIPNNNSKEDSTESGEYYHPRRK